MNNFEFHSPTEFIFGRGVESEVGRACKKYSATRVLIVYGGGSVVRSGLLARVQNALDEAGLGYALMGGCKPNPMDDKVYEGIELYRKAGADMLLAVGGGSVIDTAKAIAAGVCYDGDFWDFYAGKATIKKAAPVGVVLTIPAAGSEGSGNSVITKAETLQKISLRTPEALRPVFAIMDPELTFTLPAWQTFSGIADMMVHIFERYFTSTTDTLLTDEISEGILRAIIRAAGRLMADANDYGARSQIMWAGTLAHNGLCGTGNKEDWASHFIEHEVSAIYDVTHGAGLTVIVPAWMQFVGSRKPEKVVRLGEKVFGLESPTVHDTVAALKTFFQSIGMPTDFHTLGIDNLDIPRVVKGLERNKGAHVGSYVELSMEDVAEILMN